MPPLNCAVGDLTTYTSSGAMPWTKQRAQHAYKRMGFGGKPQQLADALLMNPADLVDQIIDEAMINVFSIPPIWANWTMNDYYDATIDAIDFELIYTHYFEWSAEWVKDMLNKGLSQKMTLFWHNHFVTKFESYSCTPAAYNYQRLLQLHAFGNFKDFVHAIGLNPAMLIFLNGNYSTAESPNENYARELYELFSLGADNGYTQEDIVETARALTGWSTDDCVNLAFLPSNHDGGEKTIFGQTGNWGYTDVIDILFEQRSSEIALFICTKIYKHFVSPEVEETIVAELAGTFLDNDFEIEPVIRQLFKSEHFFDEANMGIMIKSPTEVMIGFLNESGFANYFGSEEQDYHDLLYTVNHLGQNIFDPIDVAGWQGDRQWISNNTITIRWQLMEWFSWWYLDTNEEALIQLVKDLSNDSNDPAVVVQSVIDHFMPQGLQSQMAYDSATIVFKGDIPSFYFEQNLWNLDWDGIIWNILSLFQHFTKIPEFQMN